ncbi:MAG TPA: iron ABC transporter permease, partial [Methanoregulaceae archaeon]|nr:iron ABC transporter permease [Methanoregulaceae archaeon]
MTPGPERSPAPESRGEQIAGTYRALLGRRALALVILAVAIGLLAGVAVTLGSADLTVTEVYLAILSRFFPD